MRPLLGAVAVGAVLALSTAVRAQATTQFFPSTGTGSMPSIGFGASTPTVNVPVTTPTATSNSTGFLSGMFPSASSNGGYLQGYNASASSSGGYLQNFYNTAAGATTSMFNTTAGLINGFFHAATLGAWPPTTGASTLPSMAGVIQPVVPGGPPIIYSSAIQPMAPIMPSN
jgi:hypothetical protein